MRDRVPAGFRLAEVLEYQAWLREWVKAGRMPTLYHDYPFKTWSVLVPTEPFWMHGETGVNARRYLVYEHQYLQGGPVGHNKVYLVPGTQIIPDRSSVAVFSDAVFLGLDARLDQFIREEAHKAQEERREFQETYGVKVKDQWRRRR